MARHTARRFAILLGLLGSLTAPPSSHVAFAEVAKDAQEGAKKEALPMQMPPVEDYLEGVLQAGMRTEGARSTRIQTPQWNKSPVPMNGLSDTYEAVEAPQAVEEGGGVVGMPASDDIDLTGLDLTDQLSMSIGSSNHGRLVNGVLFPEMPGVVMRGGEASYGTAETVAALRYGIAKVHEQFPGTHDVVLGDISRSSGGRLHPHVSHQNGRDVDMGYFYKFYTRDFIHASAANLDVPRTWAFIEALLEGHKVEYFFIDYAVQALLYNYVKYELGAPQAYLEQVFSYRGGRNAIIRHTRGHRNHLHVRFWSPIAVAAAQGLDLRPLDGQPVDAVALASFKRGTYVARENYETTDWGAPPTMETVQTWKNVMVAVRVKSGDSLSELARRHHVSVTDLRRWNGLKSDRLRSGQSLKIQKRQLVQVEVPVQVASVPAKKPAVVETAPLSLPAEDEEIELLDEVAQAAPAAEAAPAASVETELDVAYVSLEDVQAAVKATQPEAAPVETTAAPVAPAEPVIPVAMATEEPKASGSKAVEKARAALAESRESEAQARFRSVERVRWAKVGSGDNLWKLARANNTTVDELLRLNPGLSRTSKLKPGQSLKVQKWVERVPLAPASASQEAPKPAELSFGG